MAPEKPSDREDEYFLKIDSKKIETLRGELDEKRKNEQKQKNRETHWMKCPKCGSDLTEQNLGNVMIDKCLECQGIWLDSGELELLTTGQAKFTKGLLTKLFR
ncbi:zf-TFIIB domain-containing protein [Thermodesulfobacteriota bacterium]